MVPLHQLSDNSSPWRDNNTLPRQIKSPKRLIEWSHLEKNGCVALIASLTIYRSTLKESCSIILQQMSMQYYPVIFSSNILQFYNTANVNNIFSNIYKIF